MKKYHFLGNKSSQSQEIRQEEQETSMAVFALLTKLKHKKKMQWKKEYISWEDYMDEVQDCRDRIRKKQSTDRSRLG